MGINKAILLGNLGKDPELRYTNSQTAVCSFSLATGERRKDQTGKWVDHTEWHNIICFGKTAENCSNYLKKGRQVFIEGRIQTRKWQDKEGRDRWTTEIIAGTVQFVGAKDSQQSGMTSADSGPSAGAASVVDSLPSADALAASAENISFDDDDIPF